MGQVHNTTLFGRGQCKDLYSQLYFKIKYGPNGKHFATGNSAKARAVILKDDLCSK